MADINEWATLLDALADTLAESGEVGWLVGGCLRDALLGVPVGDVDVAVTGEPLSVAERLAALLGLTVARLGHGTVRLATRHAPHIALDLTALHGDTIAADLARRDYTVNAMALPLPDRDQWLARMSSQRATMPGLLDPYDGREDAQAHRLVAIGPDVFRHDPGRIVRAARLRARFDLIPDDETLRLAREAVPLLATLSADRLRDETAQLMALPSAVVGLDLLNPVGALHALYPGLRGAAAAQALATLRQLDLLMGIANNGPTYPALHVWSASERRRIALREATLAHAGNIRRDQTDSAAKLWQRAQAALTTDDARERVYAARLLFAQSGRDEAAAVDALLIAAATLRVDSAPHALVAAAQAEALIAIYLSRRQFLIPPPLVSGKDLMVALALPPGPAIGRLLHALRRAQLADEIASRDAALALARYLHEHEQANLTP